MDRAKSETPALRLTPRGGGDTLAIWRRQGKTGRIKALTLLGGKRAYSQASDGVQLFAFMP